MSQENNLPAIAFKYNGVEFRFDDRRFINLTEMWKLNQSLGDGESKQSPSEWKRREGKGFIADLAKTLNTAVGRIMVGERGKGGSTSAHWQIALAYAKYLSHEFHRYVNEAFRDWAEEKADPALKAQRAAQAYIERGFEQSHAMERVEGIFQRKSFVSTLADHNSKRTATENPFAEATRSISLAVLGQTPSEIKKSKGLKPTARTRDHLTKHELTRLRFAESEAELLIKEEAADGNAECLAAVRRAGNAVKVAIASLSANRSITS